MLKNLKQFNLSEIEEKVLKFWRSDDTFKKSLKKNKKSKRFVFFEGPPTANGRPGIHHVLSRSFKDIILRYKTMRGFYVDRKAGWDTHGLPVEIEVEKELGINSKPEIEKYGVAKFNQRARQSVWKYKTEWEKLTERVGFWIDFDDPYVTYEAKYIETLWWVISEIDKRGFLYEGHRVAPWCPRCGTSLSSHEIAQGYKTITDKSVYVKFKIRPGQKIGKNFKSDDNTYVLAWTTTPWTLPGNVALAVGEKVDYQIVENKDSREKYIVAKKLSEKVLGEIAYETKELIKGTNLLGTSYQQLFDTPALRNEASHKIYSADFVTTEDGTGVVHTAVMYGEDDYELGSKIGLPKHHTVDEAGRFTNEVSVLSGKKVRAQETENTIFSYLEKNNFLFRKENYKHDYPFCWRCSTALIYYARASWFIAMSKLRKELMSANNNINWYPEHIKTGRFGNWLEEAKDWNFSRERYWGTPLPIWRHTEKENKKNCEHYVVVGSLKELDKLAIKKEKGKHNWPTNKKGEVDLHKPGIDKVYIKCPKCGEKMSRVKELIDGWFDSGAMPFAEWHYPFENKRKIEKKESFPADYIVEGIDQTRGWFYTLLAVSVLLGYKNPYKNVISLGLILDKDGYKMSKSKGNIVDPWEMTDKYGADAIRWNFFTASDPGEPKRFDENDLGKVSRRLFGTLYNSFAFLATFQGEEKKKLSSLDRWIEARTEETVQQVTENLESYNIFQAGRKIEALVDDLSKWYIRRSRKNPSIKTLKKVLIDISVMLAPFTPFFADALYQSVINKKESVHLADWPKTNAKKLDKKLLIDMEEVRKIASLALAARESAGIRVRQPLRELKVKSEKLKGQDELIDVLAEEVNVKKVSFSSKIKNEVELDTNITAELRAEGNMREILRLIQGMRRDAELTPKNKIVLVVKSADNYLKEIIQKNEQEIKSQVNAKEITFRGTEKTTVSANKKIDGKSIEVGIRKI